MRGPSEWGLFLGIKGLPCSVLHRKFQGSFLYRLPVSVLRGAQVPKRTQDGIEYLNLPVWASDCRGGGWHLEQPGLLWANVGISLGGQPSPCP